MGILEGLRLILIYLYVPALTSRSYRSEIILHLSEKVPLFALCCVYIYMYIFTYHRQREPGRNMGFGDYRL